MAIDLTPLQPAVGELDSAQSAYDAALREQAAAALLVKTRPGDAAATARAQLAARKLAAARAQVERARALLDAARIGTLATLDTGDRLLGSIAGSEVLALFPVGVEAKLEAGRRLRIRVWPDAVSSTTHDPRLSEAELVAGQRYWRAEAGATTDADRRAGWRALADELGPTRAAWVARTLTPANSAALAPGVEPVLPTVPMLDEAAPFVARAAVLPDRWIAIGYRAGAKVIEQTGAPIPADLATGLDTTPAETAALDNREGEPIQLPPRMRWMTDFEIAKQVGMALEIPLASGIDRIDLLLVFGVRVTQTPARNAEALADLFAGHRFSRGLAFVPQGTPTNNSIVGGAGMPSRSQRIDAGYDLERQPRAYPPALAPNGVVAATAFGVAPEVFAPLPASGAVPGVAAEPDGFEPDTARAMQTALWQVTLGAAFEDFIGLTPTRADALREYFRANVRASGPVPAIRVGRQPYGVLPVTQLSAFVPAPTDGIDPRLLPLLKAARSWWAMLRQPETYEGSPEEALRDLGRSTQLYAETVRQDGATGGQNRWASLASALAVATRNTIRDDWRTAAIRASVDGTPQPVTRVVVDPAIGATLATLASASPAAIRAAPLPESVLGRMARQAALLEWGRLARAVCDAALDAASITSLRRSAVNGIQVYIAVLERAMSPGATTGTAGTIGPIGGVVTRGPGIDRLPISSDGPPDPRPDPTPEDPPTTHPPVPQPTPEEIAIDATELKRIADLLGSLAAPKATCPGAARLASFRDSLALLAQLPPAQLEAALFGTLDLANYRVDAWMTSLATRRLAALRSANPQGVVIGGWGCLQDIRPANAQDPQQRAEFIHTPSLDQAAAAAVLRSAANRARAAGSTHADIDLSSRRVRLARWLLEGIRNGRSLGELLGVRFERSLKGTAGEPQLEALRRQFSVRGSSGVLDGLRLQQAGVPAASDPAIVKAAQGMEDALDALTDALTAESVFQLVRGNPGSALVNLEAIANGAAPPPLSFTETPASATRLTHRIVMSMPAGAKAPGWNAGTPRSQADPLLDAWCGTLLGPSERTVLTVEAGGGVTVPIDLAALQIGAIDVVLAGRDGGVELAERVRLEAHRRQPTLTDAAVRRDRAWQDLVGLCGAMARLIARAEPLRPETLELPGALRAVAEDDLGDLPARIAAAEQAVAAVRDALVRRTDPAGAVKAAAAIGVRAPGLLLAAAPGADHLDGLLAALGYPAANGGDRDHAARTSARTVRRRIAGHRRVHAARTRHARHDRARDRAAIAGRRPAGVGVVARRGGTYPFGRGPARGSPATPRDHRRHGSAVARGAGAVDQG